MNGSSKSDEQGKREETVRERLGLNEVEMVMNVMKLFC